MAVSVLVTLGSCASSEAVPCGVGLCEPGAECFEGRLCVRPGQVASCDGRSPGDFCSFPGLPSGACTADGVCLAEECGDGVVAGDEECDTRPSATCADRGFYAGETRCTERCELDVSGCSGRCGDGVKNGGEVCDGIPDESEATCVDLGYEIGSVSCSDTCELDTSSCRFMGWRDERLAGQPVLSAMASNEAGDVVAVVGPGGAWFDRGEGWVEAPYEGEGEFIGVAFNGEGDVIAVGTRGLLALFDGVAWRAEETPVDTALHAVAAAGTGQVLAVGEAGSAVLLDASGGRAVPLPTAVNLRSVIAAGDAFVAVGDGGVIARFEDGQWLYERSPVTTDLRAATLLADGRIAIVGVEGVVVVGEDGVWSRVLPGPPERFSDLRGVAAVGDRLAVVAFGGALMVFDGRAWKVSSAEKFAVGLEALGPELVTANEVGLVGRFNGVSFESVFRPRVSVSDLCLATEATLIVGEGRSLRRYERTPGAVGIPNESPMPVTGVVERLACDGDEVAYTGPTGTGVVNLVSGRDAFEPALAGQTLSRIDGRFWLISGESLYVWEQGSWNLSDAPASLQWRQLAAGGDTVAGLAKQANRNFVSSAQADSWATEMTPFAPLAVQSTETGIVVTGARRISRLRDGEWFDEPGATISELTWRALAPGFSPGELFALEARPEGALDQRVLWFGGDRWEPVTLPAFAPQPWALTRVVARNESVVFLGLEEFAWLERLW